MTPTQHQFLTDDVLHAATDDELNDTRNKMKQHAYTLMDVSPYHTEEDKRFMEVFNRLNQEFYRRKERKSALT